jgi:preprotein translocase subunit SecG
MRARRARMQPRTAQIAAKLASVHAILSATQVFFSIILIALILMHSGKDAGLSGAFGVGAGSQLGSGSLVERNLNRWTVLFALLFVVNVILLLKVGN